jgi:hypothetical protein
MRRTLAVYALTIAASIGAWGQTEPSSHDNPRAENGQSQKPSDAPTVMQVVYYAKPGSADEVLSHRLHASDVLEKLGLPRGRVFRRTGGTDEQPDVMWECEFSSVAARDRFLKVASSSAEFDEVRKHMSALIRNAERRDWEVRESAGPGH